MSGKPSRQASIIAHVNKDHQDSLRRYLAHRLAVTTPVATTATAGPDGPELIDVSFDRLLIRTGQIEHSVPFTPPLTSWNEIRARLIDMDKQARDALGERDDVVIRKYTPPEGFGVAVFGGVAFYFACYAFLDTITAPSAASHTLIQNYYPGGVKWFRWLVQAIFWPTVVLHTAEAIAFDLTRLRPHGVKRGSPLWLAWIANCWIEGYPTFQRVDRLLARTRAQQEKKH